MSDDLDSQTIEELEQKLTSRQLGFARSVGIEYMGRGESYRRHYSTKSMSPKSVLGEATKLGSHPVISRLINLYYEDSKKNQKLTREFVINGLMANAIKGEKSGDLTASNKALELLGKVDELSMFVERQKVDGSHRHHHTAEPISPFDEFLAEAIGEAAEEPPQKLISQ